ncbi:DUF3180 domain-containing protein [Frankia sp. CNm7]|uniref:DUF3180 domain-containing protein n=1 Tax=Frankia nepalensis TaxID=1836974 RepID=A0A937RJE6_9ACTN|nr:DUF3180 domain-containing protein [Frankia nepalensis]MBL7502090.1 DUF3180 domain-containing protein [Frankia nepalensis]MBL7512677.1 DUF3180 domain-containing protein [Frankia nepalensis]MBL7520857.1 DUF3180 domain-containing protein [Frankia nepalensis]MBL7631332.1 DUF3180 domain-containing protein [Frankia nepalensis]
MRPTRAAELVIAGVVTGVLAYLLLGWTYRSLPELPRTGPLSVFVVALVELQTADITRRRLAGRPGTKPIMPITVARLAVLAKASSLTAAVMAGGWAALLGYTAAHYDEFGTAGADLITAGLGLGSAVALLAVALLLERVCRVRRR